MVSLLSHLLIVISNEVLFSIESQQCMQGRAMHCSFYSHSTGLSLAECFLPIECSVLIWMSQKYAVRLQIGLHLARILLDDSIEHRKSNIEAFAFRSSRG
jgi:hypothetical protein